MTQEEKERILEELLFFPQMATTYQIDETKREFKHTGKYVRYGFDTVPEIEITHQGFDARIGSQFFRLKTEKDLIRFAEKTIPAYCEPTKLDF